MKLPHFRSIKLPGFRDEKLSRLSFKNINYTPLAFLLPFCTLLILRLCCSLLFDGEYSMLYSDQYHQYYPFFLEFRRALRNGDSLLYSWTVGMGLDYLGLISYYLASPLNLFSVLLPESWALSYFSLLMPLKLSLASMFFAIFLKKTFRKNDWSIVVFGSFYALCAWALGYQWNIMWLDTFALLPLVVLGTIQLLRDKKFVLYTVTLFLSIFSNYYVGFFTCIFVFLVFVCYEICRWQGFRRFLGDLLRIALFSALAIGMTAILTLPAYMALKSTQSSVNTFPKEFKLNIVDKHTWVGLLDAMRQVAGNASGGLTPTFKEGLPNLYCGVFTSVLSVLFLLCRKIKLRDKLCCVFLLLLFNVSFVIRWLDYIWHGFHFTNMIPYRFSFLYSFVMLYMAYQAWIHRKTFRLWQIITAGVVTLGLVFACNRLPDALALFRGEVQLYDWGAYGITNLQIIVDHCGFLFFTGLFLGGYLAILLVCFRRRMPQPALDSAQRHSAVAQIQRRRKIGGGLMAGVMLLELCCNLVFFGLAFPGTDISNFPSQKEDTAAAIDYMQQQEADTLFYRAETTHAQTLNDGALNDYNGISTFTSSANVRVTKFMKALGYGARDTYNRYCFEESSPVSNLFLNLKYMIERDGVVKDSLYFDDVYQSGSVHLLENKTYLPLGFMVDEAILDVDLLSHRNPFDIQNDLMEAAAGCPQNVWTHIGYENLYMSGNNVQLTSKVPYGYCTYTTGANQEGTVVYTYTANRSGMMCMNLVLENRNSFTVRLNGKILYSENYSIAQSVAMCDVVPGDVVEVILYCQPSQAGFIEVTAAILDDMAFRQCYAELAKSTLALTEFTGTQVSGTVNCQKDGILYTSIPQDGNWHATVDGKPAEIVLVGDAMCGLRLTEGAHTISFRYENKAFALGWKISLACVVVFIGILCLVYIPKKKERRDSDDRIITDDPA